MFHTLSSQSHPHFQLSTLSGQRYQGDAGAPAVRCANEILEAALDQGASDIHLEPSKEQLGVRCRVDGVLQPLKSVPKNLQEPVLSRFKILSGMDIGEKRLPQDGRFQGSWQGRPVDVRVSSLPTLFGEKLVLRLLDREAIQLELESLGFSRSNLEKLQQALRQPHGLFLVTGPTGSGKSTTLYAALASLDRSGQNIITVEDPVEYQLPGISQVTVKPKIGLTFARCLRSILRQDPDTIMVGEIRDSETASMSLQAALTGHRVFSTLHTNTAVGAVNRLLDMGVEPYLAASALQTVAGQLLVRRLCPHCKKVYKVGQSDWESRYLGLDEPRTLYKAVGCQACRHTGYAGRLPLQEVLVVTEPLRRAISEHRSEGTLDALARAEGLRTLREDGKEKVLLGETSCAELLRVLG